MNQTDAILKIMRHTKSGAELRVVLYLHCYTWGHDEMLPLTLDELLHGRQQRDGTRLDEGTGLSKPAVLAGLRAGIEHGLIAAWTDRSGGGGRVKKRYGIRS